MKKDRQSNFELLRIVSILFIISWHLIRHGNIFKGLVEPYDFISNVLSALLIVHVNSMIFLTGYFDGDRKEVKKSKALKLLGTGWLYNAIFVILLMVFHLKTYTKIEAMEEFFLISADGYWFLNRYVILYLLIPYLNKVTEKMGEKEFLKFIILQVLLLGLIPVATNGRFLANDGYSLIQFIMMYYIGSFCRRYPIKENYHFKNLSTKKLRFFLGFSFVMLALIRIGFYYLGEKLGYINSTYACYIGYNIKKAFLSYASPLVILQTVAFCLFFETLNFKSKVINFIAGTSLGIYLIHDNHNIRKLIFSTLKIKRFGANPKTLIMFVVATFIIYFASLIIELIRQLFTKIIVWFYKTIKRKQIIE